MVKGYKCPKCGDDYIVRHGFVVTKTGKRQRLKCWRCGSTFYKDKQVEGSEINVEKVV